MIWHAALALALMALAGAMAAGRIVADEPGRTAAQAAPDTPKKGRARIELDGRTAYDPDAITRVRPRFDTRVEKVLVTVGQKVQKGDPLVDLYSTDLARDKGDFQTAYVQWQHDKKLYDLRKKLFETGAISRQLWVDTQNDEQKSRLNYNLARDKLQVYEVPREEIDALVERVKGKVAKEIQPVNVLEARMTLRAKTDGVVIERDVVPGNFYQTTDVLMVLAPLDHLWVLVDVPESERVKIRVGQAMEVRLLSEQRTIRSRVDYVADEASKDTRSVKFRGTIPNPEGRLKPDMLVRVALDPAP
jgi:cobalt-zinc-cadmium efflux system membrane fusion protein